MFANKLKYQKSKCTFGNGIQRPTNNLKFDINEFTKLMPTYFRGKNLVLMRVPDNTKFLKNKNCQSLVRAHFDQHS